MDKTYVSLLDNIKNLKKVCEHLKLDFNLLELPIKHIEEESSDCEAE